MPIRACSPRVAPLLAGAALLSAAAALLPVRAAEPAKDHPLVGRYEGAVLEAYKGSSYDEAALIQGPLQNWGGAQPDRLKVEGKVGLYYYRLPAERSTLEGLRNYEASLKAKGFERVFSCATSDASCYLPRPNWAPTTAPYDFALAFDDPEWPRLGKRGDFVRNYFSTNARYLLARRATAQGTVYASIALSEHRPEVGNYAFVRVVESKAVDSDKIVFVDATAMAQSLAGSGRVALYGILFDTDKADIQPASRPTLDEMVKLMRNQPQLKLQVVGHTDNQGGEAHNKDLSQRRSVAVVAALVQAGIDPRRLTHRGAGLAEPVAPNDSDAGRAKNRRVELVKQ